MRETLASSIEFTTQEETLNVRGRVFGSLIDLWNASFDLSLLRFYFDGFYGDSV